MLQQKIHFRVETPLFCSGYDPSLSEWRATSLKGVMRYWYRAIQPDTKKEKEIFGSTKKQSMIHLHVDRKRFNKSKNYQEFPNYFSFFLKNQKREYIKPGSKFTLRLLYHPEAASFQRDVLISLWLMTTIGGLGARCRRGFGTLSVLRVEGGQLGTEIDLSLGRCSSIQNWAERVQDFLQQCWRWYPPSHQITHPMVHPKLKMFVPESGSQSWNVALKKAATILKQFRKQNKKNTRILKVMGTAEERERYPSAAWLRLVRIQNRFYPVFFVLPSDLSPDLYQEFIQLWGEWLVNHHFEMSEFDQ